MKINIKFMSSDTINFELDSDDPLVSQVKEKITEIKDSKDSVIRLIFAGKVLDDGKNLSFYKIDESCQIICLIRKNTPVVQAPQNNSIPDTTPTPTTTPLSTSPENLNSGSLPNFPSGMPGMGGMPMPNFPPGMPGMGGMPPDINMMNQMFQNPQVTQMMSNMMQNPQMREFMVNSMLQRLNIPNDSPFRSFYENLLDNMSSNPEQFLNTLNSMQHLSPQNMSNLQNFGPHSIPNIQNMLSGLNMNQQPQPSSSQAQVQQAQAQQAQQPQPSSSQVQSTVHEEEKSNDELDTEGILENIALPEINIEEGKEKYPNQIEEIKSMGFEDETKIIEALTQCNGSVTIALNKLLE